MNIRVDLNYPIKDGTEVVFRSPVDCSRVTGLKVYYHDGSQEFVLADAHGNNVGQIAHLFAEDVVVKVILDVTTGMAFVQNADTNAYIERTFVKSVNGVAPDENGNVNVAGGGGGGGAEIDDEDVWESKTWSSQKIVVHIDESIADCLVEGEMEGVLTDHIEHIAANLIDDDNASENRTWSSKKISGMSDRITALRTALEDNEYGFVSGYELEDYAPIEILGDYVTFEELYGELNLGIEYAITQPEEDGGLRETLVNTVIEALPIYNGEVVE